MKNVTLIFVLLFSVFIVQAQTVNDSVSQGTGYANLAFYNLATGDDTVANARDWDIQIWNYTMSQSLRVNDGYNVGNSELYKLVADDTTQWNSVDTTGMIRQYNADTSWESGAFTALAGAHPDYGWGVYTGNGNLVGKRIFVIKTIHGNWKKIWIKRLTFDGTHAYYEIATGNLDNTNEVLATIRKTDYPTKEFIYYAIDSNEIKDIEPAKTDWHLVFRKYLAQLDTVKYPVSGVLAHPGVLVAEARGVDVNSDDYSGLTFSENISTIGSDWKDVDSTFQFYVIDSLAYFVDPQDGNGNIYKLVFTKFAGTASGKSFFTKTRIASAVSVGENLNLGKLATYPNPAAEKLQTLFTLKNDTKVTINIFDLAGKTQMHYEVQARAGLNNFTLNVNELQQGLYLLSVHDGNNKLTYKFVKN